MNVLNRMKYRALKRKNNKNIQLNPKDIQETVEIVDDMKDVTVIEDIIILKLKKDTDIYRLCTIEELILRVDKGEFYITNIEKLKKCCKHRGIAYDKRRLQVVM